MEQYAVFGSPIKQSKSPLIHQQFAQQCDQEISYVAIEPPLDDFDNAVKQFIKQGGKGANVTMPFKEQAYAIADNISARAQLAGAVNTLVFNDDGTISADNTDGAGLLTDLLANNAPLSKRILLIGAGGAAKGVIKPLLDCQPQSLAIVNRTPEKAQQLASQFAPFGNVSSISIESLSSQPPFDVVINSTSTSLSGELPPVPQSIFNADSFVYDMVYQAKPTIFLQWAIEKGCTHVIDGLGMLVGQAAESFFIWRGVKPDRSSVLAFLRTQLNRS